MSEAYYDPHAPPQLREPSSATSNGSYLPNDSFGDHVTYNPAPQLGLGIPSQYANGVTAPSSGAAGGGTPDPVVRKKLASWVGFSNLPNQVHRRSVR